MEEICRSVESSIEQLSGYSRLRVKTVKNIVKFICCPYADLSKVDLKLNIIVEFCLS